LHSLEEVCGCALFQRTPSGFRPTDEGEAMLRYAERMEEEALALQRQFAGNDGELQGQLHDVGAQHLPGEEVGEHRSTGERKYYFSNLPAGTPIKQLAGAIKARWVCEQAHQQLKEELGHDHFEGRSWKGLHRHALMSMIALAFLQSLRLKQAKGGKRNLRPATETEPASDQTSHH
jgi:SRSO17 transposase